MFHIDNYLNVPAAFVACALILALTVVTLLIYVDRAKEADRRRQRTENLAEGERNYARRNAVTVIDNEGE